MAISGKYYYECPAELVIDPGGNFYRPLLATAVESSGGAWAICAQDSDTLPARMIVAVNDRLDKTLPRNAAVHASIPQQVASARAIDAGFAAAQAKVGNLFGAGLAAKMNDQTVGGE